LSEIAFDQKHEQAAFIFSASCGCMGGRAAWFFMNEKTPMEIEDHSELLGRLELSRCVAAGRAYSPDPALAVGFVSGLGFGVGRETPMLSKTNPKPFLSVSKKLMVPLPFRFQFDFDQRGHLPLAP
jgi:hypothetical protein